MALPDELRDLPPFFAEILNDLQRYKKDLGGLRNFPDFPRIEYKVKAEEFRSTYTDYEYVFMTVLGFARLHTHVEEIVAKNNGQIFTQNPGVQLLQKVCGMTMHGDREGANALLRSAPVSMLEAYRLARVGSHGTKDFFKHAFDRSADPCLEGRTGRLLEYLEKKRSSSRSGLGGGEAMAPWEDISLRPVTADVTGRNVIGEHLRVFMNECTWRWSQSTGIPYEEAKTVRLNDEHFEAFSRLYNAATFEAAMRCRGVVSSSSIVVWEIMVNDHGTWEPYEEDICAQIERARQRGQAKIEVRLGPKSWRYEIDVHKMLQLNPKTGKERPIRRGSTTAAYSARGGKLSSEQLSEAIQYFVDLQTLPPASCAGPLDSRLGPAPLGSAASARG